MELKLRLLLGMIILNMSLVFFGLSFCSAAELSSREIKTIENGIARIKSEARGIQSQGYEELKDVGPASTPYLIEVLKDKSVNRESRTLACDLLGELKAKEAVPTLIYILKDKSYTTRVAACKALGLIADPSAAKPLLDMLGDEEADVREAAVYALMNFKDSAIPPSVAKLLKDSADYVRVAAITLLDSKLDPKTAVAIREALAKDKLEKVRQIAAKTLGSLKDKNGVDVLVEALTEDKDHFVREASAVSLGKIGDKKAIPALIKALKDIYKDVQLRASYSLKDITGQDFARDYDKWLSWYEGQNKK